MKGDDIALSYFSEEDLFNVIVLPGKEEISCRETETRSRHTKMKRHYFMSIWHF